METSLLEQPVETAPTPSLDINVDPTVLETAALDFDQLEIQMSAEANFADDQVQLEASGESIEKRPNVFRRFLMAVGRTAIGKSAVVELVGSTADVGIKVIGAAVGGPVANLAIQEAGASVLDGFTMSKMTTLGSHEHSAKQSKARRYGHLAMLGAVGYFAQKVGYGLESHISEALKDGAGHMALPISMKLAATTGFQSATKRLGL